MRRAAAATSSDGRGRRSSRQAFGQQFVIENRGGAGGMIGTEAASKAAPDGYTFLMSPNATLTVLPHMRKTPYDPKSFLPVSRIGDFVTGFSMHPAVGPKTFKEMIDYAKANPGKLSYGSAGLGTATHLRLEMLKYRAGIDILHVPYRGSADALNDLLPNTVQMMNEINNIPHVKAGQLAPAQHQSHRAASGVPGHPDAHRARHAQLRRADLVRDHGAGRHAAGDHRQAQRQVHRDRQDRRHAGAHARDQCRAARSRRRPRSSPTATRTRPATPR